jgi:hypothetical protein
MPKLLTPQTVFSRPEQTYAAGPLDTPAIDLPDGTIKIDVTYTIPSWPAVSDGQITVAFLVSRAGGAFTQEWADTFAHQALSHGGVPVSSIVLGVTLPAPLAAGDKLKVHKDSTVPFTTAITAVVS